MRFVQQNESNKVRQVLLIQLHGRLTYSNFLAIDGVFEHHQVERFGMSRFKSLARMPVGVKTGTATPNSHGNPTRPREPQLLILEGLFGDPAVRQIIDECFVPVLVDEFIRLKLSSTKSSEQSHNGEHHEMRHLR